MRNMNFMAGVLAVLMCTAPALAQTRRDNNEKKTTTTTTRSRGNSTSSQTRRSWSQEQKDKKTTTVRRNENTSRGTGSATRQDDKKTTTTVRRTDNTSRGTGSASRQDDKKTTTTVRRTENTSRGTGSASRQDDKKTTTTVRRNENTSRSTGSASRQDDRKTTTTVRRTDNTGRGNSSAARQDDKKTGNSAGTGVGKATDVVKVNNNVTRRGLSSGSGNDRGERDNRYNYGHDYRVDRHDVVRIPPRERDFMPYNRPGVFYGRDPHYFGYRVEILPPHHRKVRYFGVDYFCYGDIYYRPYGRHYVVCRPPVGVMIDVAFDRALFRTVSFAFYSNVYRPYSGFDSYSRYIDEQNRTIARNNAILAQQNAALAMNLSLSQSSYDIANRLGLAQSYAYANQEYFYEDGVFYIFNGSRYQVIVPPAGALVDELPDDYDVITLGNAEYYKVDDTVYRVTMVSGRPYLEVLGQMYGNMARKYRGY